MLLLHHVTFLLREQHLDHTFGLSVMSGLLTYPADTFKATCRLTASPWVLGCEAFAPLVSLPTLRMGLHIEAAGLALGEEMWVWIQSTWVWLCYLIPVWLGMK